MNEFLVTYLRMNNLQDFTSDVRGVWELKKAIVSNASVKSVKEAEDYLYNALDHNKANYIIEDVKQVN